MDPDKQNSNDRNEQDSAADIVRQKIENLYKEEPDAKTEEREVENVAAPSKHQRFMLHLTNSGKSMEEVQDEWHKYYIGLDNKEKKEVWDEFYASNAAARTIPRNAAESQQASSLKTQVLTSRRFEPKHRNAKKPRPKIEHVIKQRVSARGQLKAKHYFQSLLFGLSVGVVVLVIFLFSFFNEIIIAPLIQPGRSAAATPVIIGQGDLTATNVDQIIIPKINVEIPVDYAVDTTNENVIENDLEGGVIHYPDTSVPGQIGNAAFFGHSSNNIFNAGKYKFAFVLLHTLVNGDTFYLTYNHTVYIYKVISKTIVSPSSVYVLGSVPGQVATATLITCDPPGTSINRLVVVGQQISPSISTDTEPAATFNLGSGAKTLPSNGPSLWNRLTSSDSGKTSVVIFSVVIIIIIFRRVSRRPEY